MMIAIYFLAARAPLPAPARHPTPT
jgi:hypothetical protein